MPSYEVIFTTLLQIDEEDVVNYLQNTMPTNSLAEKGFQFKNLEIKRIN